MKEIRKIIFILTGYAEGGSRFSDSGRAYNTAQVLAAILKNDANEIE